MDALILAAGLGARLGSIGQTTPKALLEVGGRTMLERTVRRLVEAGADRIIVNVHHQADRIERYVDEHDLGVDLLISR
jgi:MurNAc alpha-1-phosphate uridylyltransferase